MDLELLKTVFRDPQEEKRPGGNMAIPMKDIIEEKNPYLVNKTLFDEATNIKNQMRMMTERLHKMEEHRKEVSESVYLKVKNDYTIQLEKIRQSFEVKSQEIKNELQQLYSIQKDQQAQLESHQEILEEAKFRHLLGEFNDKRFKELEAREAKEIGKFNEILNTIQNSIRQYEGVIGESPKTTDSDFTEKPASHQFQESRGSAWIEENTAKIPSYPQPVSTLSPSKQIEPTMTEADKITEDLDMFLSTEGDYFTQDSEAIIQENAVEIEESISVSTQPIPESLPASEPASVSKIKPDDDSISSILRNIPFDEESSDDATRVEAKSQERKTSPEASLLLIEGNLDEHEFSLRENTSIGRSPSNDIVLKETKVSRQHAHIDFKDGKYILIDLKSSNGIYVNGKRVEETSLKDGDEITIGSFKFQFNLN